MPSDKYRFSNASRSLRHAAHNFFGTFNVGSSATFSYAALNSSQSLMHALDESEAALADRRSAHNALERQRRENLNIKFQELAHALPSLQSVRRPSKTMIVAKSLEFVANSIQRETKYMNQILELRKENERLRNQVTASVKILKSKAPRRARSPLAPNNKKIRKDQNNDATGATTRTPSPVIEQQPSPPSSTSNTVATVSTPTPTCSFSTAVSSTATAAATASMSVSPAEPFLFWISPSPPSQQQQQQQERQLLLQQQQQHQQPQDFFAMMYAYQRDPLSTPGPPSYSYYAQQTIDPALMFTSPSPPDHFSSGKLVADPYLV